MHRRRGVMEFEGTVDRQGRIIIPDSVLQLLETGRGRRISVRLSRTPVSSDLEKKGVSEEEIERIAALQLEPREQVVKFLTSQGSLRKHKRFRARIGTGKGSR